MRKSPVRKTRGGKSSGWEERKAKATGFGQQYQVTGEKNENWKDHWIRALGLFKKAVSGNTWEIGVKITD